MNQIDAVKSALAGLKIEENPALVKQKSRDFFWYSPVLKGELDHITADIVVNARNEDEIGRVIAACCAHDVPLTVRGAGTGNYGQAMPLAGGLVLDVSAIDDIRSIAPGRVVTGPGAIISRIDEATRAHSNQELRLHPSTARTASIAGFIAGGSGGVGSIGWGGLRDLGNIIRLRVLTMEETPRALDIRGADLHKVSHAYGTNGIITEVEMPLAPAYEWIELLVAFDDLMPAARFADEIGVMDGLLKKELAVIGAPVPYDYFLRHQKFLSRTDHVVVAMIAPQAVDAFLWAVGQHKGRVAFRSDTASLDDKKGLPPVYELAWNHTTLRALRVDPSITYLQVLYPHPNHLELIDKMHRLLGDEAPVHLEFTRFNGNITAFGLPLVRYTTTERLNEIIRLFEKNGCPVFNPHRYTLEEGGMKQSNPVQLAFKKEADPKGLLNPGKMIAWDDPDYDFHSGKLYLFPGMQEGQPA